MSGGYITHPGLSVSVTNEVSVVVEVTVVDVDGVGALVGSDVDGESVGPV